MKRKNNKSQGALEYLLLIGGGVVLATTIITIILATNSTQNEAANKSFVSQMCTLKAAQATNPPTCTVVSKIDSILISHIYIKNTKTCWECTGNYPKCIAEKKGVYDDSANCGGGNNIEV